MEHKGISRRRFLGSTVGIAAGAVVAPWARPVWALGGAKPVVSIARIEHGNIGAAVEKAIDLLGGIDTVTAGKERIMLKPNLVDELPADTTKPKVIKALARLMQKAGKEVLIGEASALATGFNVRGETIFRTKDRKILDDMQQFVFDTLGYTQLAGELGIPLVNLHSGEMVDVAVPDGLLFDRITLHRSLTDIDLLCSVPMMKTHALAKVTLGMKNLIGLYPGTVYYAVRAWMHDLAFQAGSPNIAYEILDMVKANKLGLVVVDGSTAMEGNGPFSSSGSLVKMDLIVAGTNPLATDMVTADIMSYDPNRIPTFTVAHSAGMTPVSLAEIEVRGEKVESVRRKFVKPNVVPWSDVSGWFGAQELIGEPSAIEATSWGKIKNRGR